MKHKVTSSRLNRLSRVLLNCLLCRARRFAQQVVLFHNLVTFACGRAQTRALFKTACLRVNARDRESGPGANKRLLYL